MKKALYALTMAGVFTAGTAHAGRIDLSLEGHVASITTTMWSYHGIEPVGWFAQEVLHPKQYEGLIEGDSFTLRLGYDSRTGLLLDGALTDSVGTVIPVTRTGWSPQRFSDEELGIFVPLSESQDARVTLTFAPDRAPLTFSAAELMPRIADIRDVSAGIGPSYCPFGSSSWSVVVPCTYVGFGVERLTIATEGLTFVVPVPEPANSALMLLGFGGVALAMRRARRSAPSPSSR